MAGGQGKGAGAWDAKGKRKTKKGRALTMDPTSWGGRNNKQGGKGRGEGKTLQKIVQKSGSILNDRNETRTQKTGGYQREPQSKGGWAKQSVSLFSVPLYLDLRTLGGGGEKKIKKKRCDANSLEYEGIVSKKRTYG